MSFDVPPGSTFGIIGRNGSGKSTMLKLIAGIGEPTSGDVKVHGRVSALIELGRRLPSRDLGRENVFINGMMLGSRSARSSRFDEIVAFAELEDFIDAPVKTYSSGMYAARLCGRHQRRSRRAARRRGAGGRRRGVHAQVPRQVRRLPPPRRTVLLVTHSLDLVARFATRRCGSTRASCARRAIPDA